jgi:hypothetical protein
MTKCHELKISTKKKITLNFNGGKISSDAGLLLIKEFENKLKITDRMVNCIEDTRDHRYIEHTVKDLINQRLYSWLAGYEDCIDANELRKDQIIKVTADQISTDKDLASQPTLSRFENMVTAKDNLRLQDLLLDMFIERIKSNPPETLTIDIDGTDDPAYGCQQLTLFNGYYGQNMYSPLIISAEGHFLDILLRKGNAHGSWAVIPRLKRIIPKLKKEFPNMEIMIRIDAGGATPKIYEYCENNDLKYVIGLIKNSRLKNEISELSKQAEDKFNETKEKQKFFGEINYQADSWNKSRRVIMKAEHNEKGSNKRFVITNIDNVLPENLYNDYYTPRGNFERIIDDLKNGFNGDKLSCHRFIANQFRLLMAVFQYEIIQLFREYCLNGTELSTSQAETIRRSLIKIGARIKTTVRRIWVECCSSYPFKNLIKIILDRIHNMPEFMFV